TVTLPNGKTTVVEVPVNVTPVKGIETPVTNTPLTPEDYTKGITIPEGGKVTNVENIPDLTTPGKKAPVKVTVELPNGKTITVDVPVNVTPVKGIETPVTNTPLTPEDIEKHVKVPEGGKIIGVGEIPKVNTPGDKGTVKVKIELPNGKQIEVEVPVNVTPIKDIVKKLGDPITNEDVEKHIQIPEGGKIISIGDKPSTDVPGERPSVPVVIELPGGKRVTVKVPVIVTPKTTPVVVEVGTPITEDMVKQHVDLPEGWKITKVGEIPKTNTPGDKPSVTVEIELPDGRKVTVEVPVKVTSKSNHGNSYGNNGSSTTHIVTRYQDGDGKEISPNENGSHGPKTLEGYEYIGTKTDKNGNVIHTYKKVTIPTRSEQPSSPETPTSPEKPVATPVQTSSTDSKPVAVETTVANDKKELPNTGTEDKSGLASLGLLGMLGAFGLVARKKKED
ncbi:Rib/alpha-like domain-containing protein, partial [Streptococcus mitis]